MENCAEFKTGRTSNFFYGLGALVLGGGIVFYLPYLTEEDFLNTRVRRGGGIMKLIEQTIGWDLFLILMIAFGLSMIGFAVVSLWKVINPKSDVTAFYSHLEFHPAVRPSQAKYDEVSHWEIKSESGSPALWLHFYDPYWSLQGIFKRQTLKLEGDKEQLLPLVNFFSDHPIMSKKFLAPQ